MSGHLRAQLENEQKQIELVAVVPAGDNQNANSGHLVVGLGAGPGPLFRSADGIRKEPHSRFREGTADRLPFLAQRSTSAYVRWVAGLLPGNAALEQDLVFLRLIFETM